MTRKQIEDLLVHLNDLKQKQAEFIQDLNAMVSNKNKETMRKFDTTKRKFVLVAQTLPCTSIIELLEKAKETCNETSP